MRVLSSFCGFGIVRFPRLIGAQPGVGDDPLKHEIFRTVSLKGNVMVSYMVAGGPACRAGGGGNRPIAMSHSFDDSHMVSQRILKMFDVLESRESAASANVYFYLRNISS